MHYRTIIAALMLAASIASAHAEIAVIVHPDNPVTSISEMAFNRLYLGRLKTFPDGYPPRGAGGITAAPIRGGRSSG